MLDKNDDTDAPRTGPSLPYDPFYVGPGGPMIAPPAPSTMPPPRPYGQALEMARAAATETRMRPLRAKHYADRGEDAAAAGDIARGVLLMRLAHGHDPLGRHDQRADLIEGLHGLFVAAGKALGK